MAKKQILFKTKGMNRDLSVSAFNPEFVYENRNLRLSTAENNTLLSWVNEKGPRQMNVYPEDSNGQKVPNSTLTIEGTVIGTAVLNHYLVLFTTRLSSTESAGSATISRTDRIYRLRYVDYERTELMGKMLYEGDLNFSTQHPLETLSSYEAETIQKVYWVDGVNQPRFINIVDTSLVSNTPASHFDFVCELQLQETVTVKKILGSSGMFAPGVIQYCFTYYNKNGQESNIFHTTPLLYISHTDRGASPEDKCSNSFEIKVRNVDMRFDYLRVYSIQRTSINGTPICKRIQDISTENLSKEGNLYMAKYTDTGFNGDSIDPTELLYKGGEAIIAGTLEQKDNTLFLGNISIKESSHYVGSDIETAIKEHNSFSNSYRTFYPQAVTVGGAYPYSNQLTSYADAARTKSVPCGGFKQGNFYRCGVQFQDKYGKWSNPVYMGDYQVARGQTDSGGHPLPYEDTYANSITVPTIRGTITNTTVATRLIEAGYVKARPVVVFPDIQDKAVLCQGVAASTMYTLRQRDTDKDNCLYAQSSWFFRFGDSNGSVLHDVGAVAPKSVGAVDNNELYYTFRGVGGPEDTYEPESGQPAIYNPWNLRMVEVQGSFNLENRFRIDKNFLTFHSPDLVFDDQYYNINFTTTGYQVGTADVKNTLSDIDIQTETPTVSNTGAGFIHKSFNQSYSHGIVSGLFYEDFLVDETGDNSDEGSDEGKTILTSYARQKSSFKWMVYLWNKSGSLNNDINRAADMGIPSAILKKKVVSNLRYATTKWSNPSEIAVAEKPEFFTSEEVTIAKLGAKFYQGNIDTILNPDNADGMYFAIGKQPVAEPISGFADNITEGQKELFEQRYIETPFTSVGWWKTHSMSADTSEQHGLRAWWGDNENPWEWRWRDSAIGDDYVDLVIKKEGVRMKYKSTPHLVFELGSGSLTWGDSANPALPIVEMLNADPGNSRFGGNSPDALRENNWVPCGESVRLSTGNSIVLNYIYGDTYYQRWDCLKTYPFTREDINQVVEIGSFMLESYTNIDGRYDRNRGQQNNLNMSPQNFNLMNPVYSQKDNFFTYKIMPSDTYDNKVFPNQITWSLTKESGADVDLWTHITLANILELDGDKGEINKLIRFNDQLLCFQDTGISQVLYNENAQISTTQGVPIEIGNSGKVNGKRYLSDTVGCSNKWSMVTTPAGIYFIDCNEKSIYLFGGQLQNLSTAMGFNTWCKQTIPSNSEKWTPSGFDNFVSYYDKRNQDVLFINESIALAYSEKLGTFTSFYDYGGTPYLCSLDDTGLWLTFSTTDNHTLLWKHQAGEYCNFFGEHKPYWMTLVGNPEPQTDKVFTNLDFRACVDGEGSTVDNRYNPFLPFDYLETWNEYQRGVATLGTRTGHTAMLHHTTDNEASLKRKFRIWRCDIPRDNGLTIDVFDTTFDHTYHPVARTRHSQDRMRNPWLYLKLMKKAATTGTSLPRAEIHDIVMTYFN